MAPSSTPLSDRDANSQHLLGQAWELRTPRLFPLAFGDVSCQYSYLSMKKLRLRELVAHRWDVVELGLEPRAQIRVMSEPVFRTAVKLSSASRRKLKMPPSHPPAPLPPPSAQTHAHTFCTGRPG